MADMDVGVAEKTEVLPAAAVLQSVEVEHCDIENLIGLSESIQTIIVGDWCFSP